MGHGIIAGSIASYEVQGRRAGDLVVRLLSGEDSATIGAQAPITPNCIADWQQLRRWEIDERLLPGDCEVRFKEITTWDRYRWQILIALAVILAQAALIIALMLNRHRLSRSRASLQEAHDQREQAETLASTLRQRLARFSRERSLGTMATAIAHEINQPLIAIQNYAQAARRRLERNADDKPKLLELHAKIEEQAARAGAITQRVRSLVGAKDLRLLPVSVVTLVEEVMRLMEPETAHLGCRMAFAPVGHPPQALADSLQVQLVLVNLLRNAMQSMCAGDLPDKTVTIDARAIDDREVQISVTDCGPGVAPERASDIFEPLSSSTSEGMGMGLTISRSIIDAHGGRLWVEPNPDGGAIFRFTLQRAKA